MRNTPITDELARQFAGKRLSSREAGAVWSLCRDLERELVEAKKQRDALAEALELFLSRVRYTSVFMNGNPTGGTFDYRSHGFDAEVELAHNALAATKGGSDE
jgi:hypothetical protein